MEHLIEHNKWERQKLILLILMIAMPVFSAVLLESRGFTSFSGALIFNSAFDLMGMIILIFIFMGVIKDREDRTRRTGFFAYLLFFTSLELFLDEIFWIAETTVIFKNILFAVNSLIYFIGAALITTFWFYLVEVTGSDDLRLEHITNLINKIQGVAMLAIIGNIFGRYYFTIDASGTIIGGKLSFLMYAYPLFVMIMALVLIFYLDLSKQKKRILVSFISLPLICLILQLTINKNLSLLYPGVLCSIVLIYGNVFAETNADLERNKNQLLQKENELLHSKQEQARLNTELELASEIQQHFLPMTFPPYPSIKNLDLYAVMHPAKEVGGDFYDFFLIDETHLGLVIADVSGKGIPAALMMMITKIMIKNAASHGLSPAETFRSVNEQLCSNNDADMFVTAWFGILDVTTGECRAANAGHEYPVFRKHDQKFELVHDKHDLVLGWMEGIEYHEYSISVNKGETLFVYTDGVAEAENDEHELFGTDALINSLNKNPDADSKTLIETVLKDIEVFADDAAQFDDITMLSIHLTDD